MKPVVIGLFVCIEVNLISCCLQAVTEDEKFNKILQEIHPEIGLPPSEIELIKSLDSDKWRDIIKRSKSYQILENENKKLEAKNKLLQLKWITIQFICAMTLSKSILQIYNYNDTGGGVAITKMRQSQTHPAPQFYESLITHQHGSDKKYTTRENFIKLRRQWYYFIQESNTTKSRDLKEKLLLYFDRNREKYNSNITELYVTFCASVARSNRLFNYLQLTFLPKMQRTFFGNSDSELYTFLFKEAPFYYLGEEDVSFINILQMSYHKNIHLNESNLIKFAITRNPNVNNTIDQTPPYQINNFKRKEVLIPLSDACPSEKRKTSVIVPFTVITRTTAPTTPSSTNP